MEPLGVGSSARPEHADYSLTAQADRIAAALDRLGVRQAIVVAHSLGASMAFRLAYRRPDLVAALPAFVVDSVPGAGHFIYEEQPAVALVAVRRLRAS